jgi:hypothetical protein
LQIRDSFKNEANEENRPASISPSSQLRLRDSVYQICRAGHDEDPHDLEKKWDKKSERSIVVFLHSGVTSFYSTVEKVRAEAEGPEHNTGALELINYKLSNFTIRSKNRRLFISMTLAVNITFINQFIR